ncbi:cytochrome P450 [uncultured Tateyamaria sp.]|uniref:cytochrome P450 n=1 Tax=uncultured Tateyamaria sp. TaxID=455651 RepID=UPI0026327BBD|nr:cytochrome P450 [uncultured Tateyamaria sp.]
MLRSENGAITGQDFKNFFCLLVAAGNDTTRYSIAMALHLLTQQQGLLKTLQGGDVWETCADEFIRLASPTLHFRRTATRDVEMHGQTIKEGDKVLMWFVSGSRDEAMFENPHTAQLDRSPNRHVAFGQGGPHVCLGMWLAKLELKCVLQELAGRIHTLEAVEPPTWTRSNFICGVKSLTFLPKPIPDRGGSGLHVNFSFADAQGANVIAPDGALSDIAKGCMAGLIHHHEGLAGLLAATVNSYDRLGPASMAGYWANWADDHRLVTTRSCVTSPRSARLEHRMADCATNPYLAVASVLQASLLGVSGGYALDPAEDLDGLDNIRATRHVPSALDKALDALDADKPLRMAAGEAICDALIFLKQDEWKRLKDKSVDQVRDYYLPFV